VAMCGLPAFPRNQQLAQIGSAILPIGTKKERKSKMQTLLTATVFGLFIYNPNIITGVFLGIYVLGVLFESMESNACDIADRYVDTRSKKQIEDDDFEAQCQFEVDFADAIADGRSKRSS